MGKPNLPDRLVKRPSQSNLKATFIHSSLLLIATSRTHAAELGPFHLADWRCQGTVGTDWRSSFEEFYKKRIHYSVSGFISNGENAVFALRNTFKRSCATAAFDIKFSYLGLVLNQSSVIYKTPILACPLSFFGLSTISLEARGAGILNDCECSTETSEHEWRTLK